MMLFGWILVTRKNPFVKPLLGQTSILVNGRNTTATTIVFFLVLHYALLKGVNVLLHDLHI